MRSYGAAIIVVALCSALNWPLSLWLAPTNLAMVYLLGVVLVAARSERGPAIACAIGGALAFDFFFVPPVFTLRMDDTQYIVTGVAMLVVGVVISTLASRTRVASQAALIAQEEQLRNSLLASLSHDLRTPLAVIAGSASSLRDERSRLSQAEQDQLLDTLYDEAQHVSLTVNDLLEMTRLHAGRVEIDRQWYPAEELIGAALERCKRQLAQHRVQTRLHADSPMLHVDAVLMEKLLVNLIENAAKYTPAGTLVTLVVEPAAADHVIVRVEDQGPGLPPGAEERVFEKFYRAERESAVTGSGLGLSICRAIAQMHGGTITARQRPGGGALFTLSLPAQRPPATEIQ
jgi:two-component system, OmpR family, sensor histidine kinase KdpD